MSNVKFSNPEDAKPKKTGKKSWKPAPLLQVQFRDKGRTEHLYWADREETNLQKKLAEQWRFVERDEVDYNVPDAASVLGVKADQDVEGSSLRTASRVEFRDSVLMAMDHDTWLARKEYFDELTDIRDIPDNKTLINRTKQMMNDEGLDSSAISEITD